MTQLNAVTPSSVAPRSAGIASDFGGINIPGTIPSRLVRGESETLVDRARSGTLDASGAVGQANQPSRLEVLASQPSYNIAQARNDDKRVTITQNAPTYIEGMRKGGEIFMRVNNKANIQITVRELRNDELGRLAGKNGPALKRELDRASLQINEENKQNYGGKDTKKLTELAKSGKNPYFNSPEHKAWARAAEARTGGKVPAEWWIKNDPFGGSSGNGPNILTGGRYPGTLSKIGMAHDTDWTLGRVFGAGPMRELSTVANPAGDYGLFPKDGTPAQSQERERVGLGAGYADGRGHADWTVNYNSR